MRALIAAFALMSFVTPSTLPYVAQAQDSAQAWAIGQCDRLAASQYDAIRPPGVVGIAFAEINPAEAVPACQAAYAPAHAIQRQLRHKSFNTTAGYIREGRLFKGSSASFALR